MNEVINEKMDLLTTQCVKLMNNYIKVMEICVENKEIDQMIVLHKMNAQMERQLHYLAVTLELTSEKALNEAGIEMAENYINIAIGVLNSALELTGIELCK